MSRHRREKPRKILVGEATDVEGLGEWASGEEDVPVLESERGFPSAGGGGGGGMMISVALKGSVIPLGRRLPVFEKARMRKVVFLDVRWVRFVVREEGRKRGVSKPFLGERVSSVQGVLGLVSFGVGLVLMEVFDDGSLGCSCWCCCCSIQVATSVAPFQLT